MTRAAALVLATVMAAGCGGGDGGRSATTGERGAAPRSSDQHPVVGPGVKRLELRVIKGWILALNREDYTAAGSYFAPGAIVDQGRPIALEDERDAIAWNSGLPCDADLTRVRQVRGHPVATFGLTDGPVAVCQGDAVVSFTIRRGKIVRWHQLPGGGAPAPREAV